MWFPKRIQCTTLSASDERKNGVPQGSILGSTIFNIYLIDLFFFTTLSEIASYADDNNPYTCRSKPDLVVGKLKDDSNIILKWI